MPTSYTAVNEAIRKEGGKERLVQGFGCHYFADGLANRFRDNVFRVTTVEEYTVEGWLNLWKDRMGRLLPKRDVHDPGAAL